ncbi:hypothetical protein [Mycolicibacterium sp. CR10]|uniref:hypothetical protein n=1 Tax=Mycolicibacterium sp. CR10 TaxID=2562314 RepID=UPI0010C11106|nr:hypothetical protein [Mycolicibacterium sp. CR10]
MPSFRRRESVIDADRIDPPPSPDRPGGASGAEQARSLAEEAEAEAAEAEAMAAAARARARAIRLRREAEQATGAEVPAVEVDAATEADAEAETEADAETEAETEADAETEAEADAEAAEFNDDVATEDAEDADDAVSYGHDEDVEDDGGATSAGSRWRRLRPSWKGIAAAVVVLCTVACLAASGYMISTHRKADRLQQQNAEYAAAARQSVVTLMSLDFNNAQDNVKRIIDNSTGQFKTDFEQQAPDFIKVARDSKVVTEVTVNSVAVESMTDTSAVALVAASSRVTNSSGANQEPRTWRLSVNLERDGGQIKMSKVEFVP